MLFQRRVRRGFAVRGGEDDLDQVFFLVIFCKGMGVQGDDLQMAGSRRAFRGDAEDLVVKIFKELRSHFLDQSCGGLGRGCVRKEALRGQVSLDGIAIQVF